MTLVHLVALALAHQHPLVLRSSSVSHCCARTNVAAFGVTRKHQRNDPVRQAHKDDLAGDPISPPIPANSLLVRYMYDGGTLAQGRLCQIHLDSKETAAICGIDNEPETVEAFFMRPVKSVNLRLN